MTNAQAFDLTKEQIDLVLRGLRFVKSSISMELLEPTDPTANSRSQRLREVESLVKHLGGAASERATASV